MAGITIDPRVLALVDAMKYILTDLNIHMTRPLEERCLAYSPYEEFAHEAQPLFRRLMPHPLSGQKRADLLDLLNADVKPGQRRCQEMLGSAGSRLVSNMNLLVGRETQNWVRKGDAAGLAAFCGTVKRDVDVGLGLVEHHLYVLAELKVVQGWMREYLEGYVPRR